MDGDGGIGARRRAQRGMGVGGLEPGVRPRRRGRGTTRQLAAGAGTRPTLHVDWHVIRMSDVQYISAGPNPFLTWADGLRRGWK